MTKKWRLILSNKCNGYYNMAVDEALLLNYSHQKIPTLRIYGWDKPFISLGYKQNPYEALNNLDQIPFVRRMTGGSVILHHRELTYSIVCALGDLDLPKGVKESYKIICSFLKRFYGKLGFKAYFAKEVFSHSLGEYKNFCFSSQQEYDLVIKEKKIGGNAQRRRKDIIFQHGSIPEKIDFLKISNLIKDTVNLEQKVVDLHSVLTSPLDFSELAKLLSQSFQQTFGVELVEGGLSDSEERISNSLLKEKYVSDKWNLKAEAAFALG